MGAKFRISLSEDLWIFNLCSSLISELMSDSNKMVTDNGVRVFYKQNTYNHKNHCTFLYLINLRLAYFEPRIWLS